MNPIQTLWQEQRSLTSIDHLDSPPTSLTFLRNYVSQNKPCLISNAISHWPALSLWPSPSYLSHTLSSTPVSIHLTPHGRADSLVPIPLSTRNLDRPQKRDESRVIDNTPLITLIPDLSVKTDKSGIVTEKLGPLENSHESEFPKNTPLSTQKLDWPGKTDQSRVAISELLTTEKSDRPEKADQSVLLNTTSTLKTRKPDHIVCSGDTEQPGLAESRINSDILLQDGTDVDGSDHSAGPAAPAWQKLHQSEKPDRTELTENTLKTENCDRIVWSEGSEQSGLTEDTLKPESSPRNGTEGDDHDPVRLCFASAFVAKTPFHEAIRMVSSSGPQGPVAYLQQQNDCFREEYGVLSGDCDGDIEWASEAFGCLPEAVNLWIGNEFSETSWHKDHYENIYAVVSGEKRFLLLPPTDVHRMYVREYPAACYMYDKGTREFKLVLEEPKRHVPWCSVDPYPSMENKARDVARFPLYFNGPKPFEVTVRAGEILYLPSTWFHYVRQGADDQGRTIAINYWHDMQFDIKYAYFNFLSSIPYHSLDGKMFPELEDGDSDSDTLDSEL